MILYIVTNIFCNLDGRNIELLYFMNISLKRWCNLINELT